MLAFDVSGAISKGESSPVSFPDEMTGQPHAMMDSSTGIHRQEAVHGSWPDVPGSAVSLSTSSGRPVASCGRLLENFVQQGG
jgi:hypothetical protein